MEFSNFLDVLPKIGKMSLPGFDGQLQMTPEFRKNFLNKAISDHPPPQWAAVLCLFYPDRHGQVCFVMIRRSDDKGVHARQMAFPGGRVSSDDLDLAATALRECEEEVGVARNSIEILRPITKVYIPPSHYWVQPFIGYTRATPEFSREVLEVDEIVQVPLSELMQDTIISTQRIETTYAGIVTTPSYRLQGQFVWGATAMMLSEVRLMIKPNI